MDPDPAFYLNADHLNGDPDRGSQTNVYPYYPVPDPSQILKSQKVEFFYMKNYEIQIYWKVDDVGSKKTART